MGEAIDYSGCRNAILVKHISLQDFGGPMPAVGDINGDGRPEFVIRQYANCYRDPDILPEYYRPEWRDVDCVTAIDLNGDVLWQRGEPWREEYEYPSHGGGPGPTIADIDGDGSDEIFENTDGELRIIDGKTGEIRRARDIRDLGVKSAKAFFPNDDGPGLIAMYSGNKPVTYAFDSELNIVFGPIAAAFSGHWLGRYPIGDGEYGLVDGFNVFDKTGRKVWESNPKEVPVGSHVDCVECGDINGDGDVELVYCLDPVESKDHRAGEASMVALSRDGSFMWKVLSQHPQMVQIASAIHGEILPQIYLGEKNIGIGAYRGDGSVIWRRETVTAYPRLVLKNASGPDRVLWCPHRSPSIVPFISDESGNPAVTFKELLDHTQKSKPLPYSWDGVGEKPLPLIRLHDFDIGYGVLKYDIDGDGDEELIIYDRYDIWIYRV